MKTINIRYNKYPLFFAIFSSSIYLVFGAVLIIVGLLQLLGWSFADDMPAAIIILLGLLTFIPCLWLFNLLKKCLNGTIKALIIDEKGIYDNSKWPYSLGFVAWKEIKAIHTRNYLFIKLFDVEFYEPKAFIARQKGILKRFRLRNQLFFNKSILLISAIALDISFKELKKIMDSINLDNPKATAFVKHLID